MGRKAVARPKVEAPAKPVNSGPAHYDLGPDASVKVVELEGSRQLLTIEPNDPIWETRTLGKSLELGAIVRVRPPASASDEIIASVREALREANVAAVKVLPRAPGERHAAVPEERERKAGRSVRQVVMERAEAAVTDDREALLRALDEVLSEVGL